MKLMLGTVQFGIRYGTFNPAGKVPLDMASVMLNQAAVAGVKMLDTARAYGDAEAVLARTGAAERFDIVSKCPDLAQSSDPVAALRTAFETSCATLGVSRLYGYLLHNAEDLTRSGVWETLCELRDAGRVARIGVSGYDAEDVRVLCNRFPLTLVQLPANVLDSWYESVELPATLEVHVRSAFLQGFLLSNPSKLPSHLAPWSATLEQFRVEAAEQGLTPVQAALAPLLASPSIAQVAVGADSPAQLDDILQAAQALSGRAVPTFSPFSGVTKNLTDPRRWRTAP
ncbi:aldo/keto reductase [Sulfitobacter sp. 1A13496]|uniref:aldo/keto reductase n=1 Tax=Sulfitobacter sp. 1A13496 TaxID=3368596 RepID=UPI003744CE51